MILAVEDLVKHYGRTEALKGVSFGVPPGSIFGILGPNGSGKTTLLGLILGILHATRGSFRWEGAPVVGTLLETPNFYPYLSGARNLAITAAIRRRGENDIPEALQKVGLKDAANQAFAKYSLGMKQRLAVGAALLGSPEVVVLDEPTNGLDPVGIAEVREVVRDLAQGGRTVILASHLLDEVEKVCTHVAILKKGQLLACGSLQDVLRDEDTLEAAAADPGKLEAILKELGLRTERKGALVLGYGKVEPGAVNRHCFEKGVELTHLVLRKQTLESRFLEITE